VTVSITSTERSEREGGGEDWVGSTLVGGADGVVGAGGAVLMAAHPLSSITADPMTTARVMRSMFFSRLTPLTPERLRRL
jgi:hypothetical protein